MNRITFRFFSVFSLFFAMNMVWAPVWAMDDDSSNPHAVLYEDGGVQITQKDLDDFKDHTLTNARFDEILPTLSDLLQDCARDERHSYSDWYYNPGGYYYIADWDYTQYLNHGTNYRSRLRPEIANKIKEKTEKLKRSIFMSKVARRHPSHKKQTTSTTSSTAATTTTTSAPLSTQGASTAIFKNKKITITQGDIHAFDTGTLKEDRFNALAPTLAQYSSELDGKLYEDYLDLNQEERTDIAEHLKSEFEALAAEQAEIKQEQDAKNTSKINQITQDDIDAFEYNELTEKRFNELQGILTAESSDIDNMTYDQYKELGSLKGQAALAAAGTSRTQITQMLVMQLNMLGAKLSMPKQRETIWGALWAVTCGTARFFTEVTVDGLATLASSLFGPYKNFFAERKKEELAARQKEAEEEAEEKKTDTLTAKADQILEKYTDEYIDTLINTIDPTAIINTIEQKKKQQIKNQNCMIAGGLMPETIDFAGLHLDIGKDMPYPIALYKKDLVYGAGFAVKAAVAYWTISQVSHYRAQHIYEKILKHTDEFITLLKELRTSEQEPQPTPEKRTWKQYARDKISGKGNDSTPLYNLKQHLNTHHKYIGYNPLKFPLLGNLALLLFTEAGIAQAYKNLIIHDDSYEESRCAYYKDDAGRFRKLPGMYAPISATQAAHSLTLSGLWSTATSKIPPTVRRAIPIPLSKKELISKLEHHTPSNVLSFLKSDTMAYMGLFAASVFQIKFMNDLYHARWHQWVREHQEYLIDLLERYQHARTLPEYDETRIQLEQEILLSIQEGNTLSGMKRATLWRTISHTAFNKVTLACATPIIAYALWHNKKLVASLGWAATKEMTGYLKTGVRMLPLVGKLGAGVAVYTWQNPRDAAQALIEIPVGLTMIAAQIAVEAAAAAAYTVAAGTIITGATIAQNRKVQKYGMMVMKAGTECINIGKQVGNAGMQMAAHLRQKFNF